MKIRALAPWFGSKRTMAPAIVAQLGRHRSYWEPFGGSLAVLLAKSPVSQETVCDLHGDLTNLAWVLQDGVQAPRLYGRLVRTLLTEPLFQSCQARGLAPLPADAPPDPERAYHYLVASWGGRNGMAGTCCDDSQIAVRWTSGRQGPAARFRSVVESIPAWHERLRNVLVLRRDAFAVLAQIEDDRHAAIYADPPYLAATRHGNRGGGNYLHDFAEGDHARLAEALRRFQRVRVVVSYYAHPRLAELYPGWSQIDHARVKALSLQQRRGAVAQEAPEVLLVNGPSYAAVETLFEDDRAKHQN